MEGSHADEQHGRGRCAVLDPGDGSPATLWRGSVTTRNGELGTFAKFSSLASALPSKPEFQRLEEALLVRSSLGSDVVAFRERRREELEELTQYAPPGDCFNWPLFKTLLGAISYEDAKVAVEGAGPGLSLNKELPSTGLWRTRDIAVPFL